MGNSNLLKTPLGDGTTEKRSKGLPANVTEGEF